MNILALDMATKTGWATNLHGRVESGMQAFDLRRGESLGMRWVRFNAWLETWAEKDIHMVVYEQNFRRGGAATEVANGFSTRVHEFCARHNIQHTNYNVHELKKFTCGHSGKTADKAAMFVAAQKKGWVSFTQMEMDDNEVDAVCLLHLSLRDFGAVSTAGAGSTAPSGATSPKR